MGLEVGEEASPSDWEGRAGVCFPNPCGHLDDLEELVKIQILRPPSDLDRVGLGTWGVAPVILTLPCSLRHESHGAGERQELGCPSKCGERRPLPHCTS